jgi:predicted dehydrogenase
MREAALKVALVGCGQIADAHLQEIRKIPGAEAVAVCDRHLDLARQAAERFEVPDVYDDLDRMLDSTQPDVLHVTTPPQSHRAIASRALSAGSHVYIEKPFAVDVADADAILDAARRHGRLVCVGHDQLFDPTWDACRRLIDSGAVGRVVHVDSVQGYNLSGPFGKVLAGDPGHWVHALPGGLFQNVMSHALYRITDFLRDERPEITATWFQSRPPAGFPTELRAHLLGGEVTGSLVFSGSLRSVQRLARVYGTRGYVDVDLDSQVVRRQRPAVLPGAFAKLEIPARHLGEATLTLARNAGRFLRGRIHYFAGMNRLFTAFYEAVRRDSEPPIAYAEIRRVTALMDEIFRCCRAADKQASICSP